jgi:hypothetical protein
MQALPIKTWTFRSTAVGNSFLVTSISLFDFHQNFLHSGAAVFFVLYHATSSMLQLRRRVGWRYCPAVTLLSFVWCGLLGTEWSGLLLWVWLSRNPRQNWLIAPSSRAFINPGAENKIYILCKTNNSRLASAIHSLFLSERVIKYSIYAHHISTPSDPQNVLVDKFLRRHMRTMKFTLCLLEICFTCECKHIRINM